MAMSNTAEPVQAPEAPPPDGPSTIDLQRFLPYRLSLLSNMLSTVIARIYETDSGLTVSEWRLLVILARYQPISANEVCTHTAMDKVRVSRAVSRAQAAGLVDRQTDSDDRRRSVLSLTPAGQTLHDRLVPLALEREREVLKGLNPEEIDQLFAMIDRLSNRVYSLSR